MFKRVLTAAVGIPLLVAAILAGRPVFTVLAVVVIFLAALEYRRLADRLEARPFLVPLVVFSAGLPILETYRPGAILSSGWLAGLAVLALSIKLLSPATIGFNRVSATVFGAIYVGLFPSYLLLLYDLDQGARLLIFTFIATWVADTAAFFIGSLAGATPLAPTLSPNKTVEGGVGSLAVTGLVFGLMVFMPLSAARRAAFGLIMAAAAMAGDLIESALKREAGVKDSGGLLPGHGGILDRIDSLLITGPTSYYLLNWWLG